MYFPKKGIEKLKISKAKKNSSKEQFMTLALNEFLLIKKFEYLQ